MALEIQGREIFAFVIFEGICLSTALVKVSLKKAQFSSRLLSRQWAKNSVTVLDTSWDLPCRTNTLCEVGERTV